MKIVWVIGSRGLLGSALERVLKADNVLMFNPEAAFSWHKEGLLQSELQRAVQIFSDQSVDANTWEIYWAAGIGTMSASQEEMVTETHALAMLLNALACNSQLQSLGGCLIFASSAGAIYAGSMSYLISESSAPAPTTAYAHAKLEQEEMVREFVASHIGVSALLARITTLYGPGQAARKNQGLLSHMARNILRNRPIQIYVPYDTIRDYIDADDAAAMMVEEASSLRKNHTSISMQIIASEKAVTIAEIVHIFIKITRRSPLIARGVSSQTNRYSRCMRFRSNRRGSRIYPKSLPIGLSRLISAERLAFATAGATSPGYSVNTNDGTNMSDSGKNQPDPKRAEI